MFDSGVDPRLIKYAQRNAPRYTSYPTAPHFDGSVDAAVYRQWLSELAPTSSVSLYLHAPYCKEMCWYCGCHAFAARRDEPVARYVEAIEREIEGTAAASPARLVEEIHWGGGTPNLLSPERFSGIVDRLRRSFDLSRLQRHAVEIDPRLLTAEQATAFANAGVNRISLGVQDFERVVQAAIGRVQPYDTVSGAVAHLRAAGIDALSFDLMYGLPHQSVDSVRRTAELALSLNPARLSVFGYAHVPWFKQRQRLIDADALPGVQARLDLAAAIRDAVTAAGYVAIGYDHYARADDPIAKAATLGKLDRNFQGFVESSCDVLIGLGPSAISTLPQGYAQNQPEVGAWREAVMAGGFATKRGRTLTADDRVRRDLIMRLLCDFDVDVSAHGDFADELKRLAPLARDGLVQVSETRVVIPDAAKPFARIVAQVFDAYALEGAARHSQAV